MKNLSKYYLLLLVVFLLHCNTEDPFLSKELVEEMIRSKAPKPVENIFFINENDIYLLPDFNSTPIRITHTPGILKKEVKVSHDYEKIAYLLADGSPEIITRNGEILYTLRQYRNVKQYDWSHDDNTLYMLIDNSLHFYGPALDIPSLQHEVTERVISAVITKEHQLLYVVEYVTGINQFSQKLMYTTNSGEKLTFNKESGETDHMSRVNLSKDGDYFTVSYRQTQESESINKAAVFKIGEAYPEFTWAMPENCINQVYDFFSKNILCATKNKSSNMYELLTIETEREVHADDHAQYYSGSSTGTSLVCVDWK